MTISDFIPGRPGQCYQGDVSIIPIPLDIAVAPFDEIAPREGWLILQEGEITGHRHAICMYHDEAMARDVDLSAAQTSATAKLYRDPTVASGMVDRGILTRADLAVACLVIEGGPMVVTHEQHDGIRLPPGKYLIGRQVESAGAEERVVRD